MSRVIKFRFWSEKRKVMTSWIDAVRIGGSLKDLQSDDDFKVMQWTGLTDDNGKEIYEGDLVKWPDFSQPLEVAFNHHSWRLRSKKGWWCDWKGDLEVIGDIYSTPELLNSPEV